MTKKTAEILRLLKELYPDARCELDHHTPFQLLLSTVLSAQTTDARVNMVMVPLYEKYPDPEDWLSFSQEEIEGMIKTIGLYRTKAANVYKLVRELMDRFGGKVPDTMEDLTSLPGVGRKTADVVLSVAFGIPAIAVDTHVFRVTNRIGIVNEKTAEKTEFALMKAIRKDLWIESHHLFIFHGRRCCTARNPQCERCPLTPYCKYYKALTKSAKTSESGNSKKTVKSDKSSEKTEN